MNSIRFELSLARRFMEENKVQTAVIIIGIAIGVSVMVFLTALIDGLQADLIQKTVGRSPHIVISNAENAVADAVKDLNGEKILLVDATQKSPRPIAEWRNLTKALTDDPRIETYCRGGRLRPDPARTGERAILLKVWILKKLTASMMSAGYCSRSSNISEGAVLLGKNLAEDLGVSAGDPIQLELSGREPLTIMIDGVFDLGTAAINQRWLIMDQRKASSLLGIGDRISTIETQVYDVLGAETIARQWGTRLPSYQVESWQESNASLMVTLSSQSSSSYTIQFFVLLAVILGVASVLAISAVQKSKQIGILKAIGIRTSSVSRVFLFQGLVLGTAGTVLGFGLGLAMSQAFVVLAKQDYNLLVKPGTAAIIITATVLASTLSAYLPARQVSKINPIEVIRNG
jgi:lipoprotein-releasing system permease protein